MSFLGIYARTSIDREESTSIEQQIQLGVEFAAKKGFQYKVYEDIGKSGYKVDDKNDAFSNRPAMTDLINDIKGGILDKVWVWENSRLSRNEIASFHLTQLFKNNNVILYEKDTLYNLNNPQNQLMHGILSQFSQYERHNIIERTKRGLYDSLNNGIRGLSNLYGYRKTGKEGKHMKWEIVPSELAKIKYMYDEYLNGKRMSYIVKDLFPEVDDYSQIRELHSKLNKSLKQFSYTGYNLTAEGLEIFKKFKKREINTLKEIINKKLYVKSLQFPEELISIEDWVLIMEKFQASAEIYNKNRKRDNSQMGTGIMRCPHCNIGYYAIMDKKYSYYRHQVDKNCKQKPKSVNLNKINKILELFIFYFYLVYDDTKVLIEENQKLIKINQTEIKDKIKALNSDNKEIEAQINNFKAIYKKETDIKKLEIIIEKELELKADREKNNNSINKLNNELSDLSLKLKNNESELTYFNIKELIINFFENWKNEEKRTALLKIIKNCQLHNNYLIIDTGNLCFVFDTSKEYDIKDMYNKFKSDVNFKDNFINSLEVENEEQFLKMRNNGEFLNYFSVRKLNNNPIFEANLKLDSLKKIIQDRLNNLNINYDITDKKHFISFI